MTFFKAYQGMLGKVFYSFMQSQFVTPHHIFMARHTKQSAWKAFCDNPKLVSGFGEIQLTDDKLNKSEQFYCKLYSFPDNIISVHAWRVVMFAKSKTTEHQLVKVMHQASYQMSSLLVCCLENVKYSKPCFAKSRRTRPEIG